MRKKGLRMGLAALPSFWSLKKGTRTFNILSNESFPDILGLLAQCDHPWGKQTKKIID